MRSISALILGLYTTSVWSGDWQSLSGRIESLLVFDNRHFKSESQLEQNTDLQFCDTKHGLYSGLNLSWRGQGQDISALKLHQFFIEKNMHEFSIRAGRLQRSDTLGYYSLDGLALTIPTLHGKLEAHYGAPHHIEDYRSVDGNLLYGLNWRSNQLLHPISLMREAFTLSYFSLGIQHFEDEGSKDWFNFAATASYEKSKSTQPLKLDLQGSLRLDHPGIEELGVLLETNSNSNNRLRVALNLFKPDRTMLTFRERFYSLYTIGRQATLKASYHNRVLHQNAWSASFRYVNHEIGADGFGVSGSTSFHQPDGAEGEVRFDALRLNKDFVATLYLGGSAAVDSRLRLDYSTALQFHDKALTGKNTAFAGEIKAEYMLDSNLYATIHATTVFNKNLDNEYRLLARLTWYFDERLRDQWQ